MLAADKLQLQSAYKQQATALKEKEFNLHHSNLMTVGTQAAVLAGLDITMFIEFNPPGDDAWDPNGLAMRYIHLPRLLKFFYYGIIVAAFCANMLVVSHTTALSVLGAGLALRGPDGSMLVATDVVYEERRTVFYIFGWGLVLTVGSVLISVWLLLHWEAACFCWSVALMGCWQIYSNYNRVSRRLHFEEHDSVDFSDILTTGPGAFRVVSQSQYNKRNSGPTNKRGSGGGGGSNTKSSPQQLRKGGARHFFKRSLSSPAQEQNNQNSINNSSRPSAHHYHHHHPHNSSNSGDEEEGRGGGQQQQQRSGEYYYHSYSSEEDGGDDSTMLLVDNGHHHHFDGNMKQRRNNQQQPKDPDADIQTV